MSLQNDSVRHVITSGQISWALLNTVALCKEPLGFIIPIKMLKVGASLIQAGLGTVAVLDDRLG